MSAEVVKLETVQVSEDEWETAWVVMFDDDPVRLRWRVRGYRFGRRLRKVVEGVKP